MDKIFHNSIKRNIIPIWLLTIARNFSITMLSSVMDSVLRFIAYGYLAKRLGPKAFGVNAYMYTTMLFFGSLADFGLRIFGAREIAAHPDEVEKKVSHILSLKFVFMISAFVMMQVFVVSTRSTEQEIWLGFIYGLGLFGLSTADWILIGLEQMHYTGIARLINGIGVFVLTLIFIQGPQDLLLVGAIESFTFLLAGSCLFYLASRKIKIRLTFQLSAWKKVIRGAFPLGISLLLVRLGSSLPILALGLFSSDYEVGIYKAVSLIPSFFDRFNMVLGDALLPTLSRIYAKSRQRFANIMVWIQKYLSITGVLLSIVVALGMTPFLSKIFGEEFQAGLSVFRVLMFSSAISFSNLTLRKLFSACHAQRRYAHTMAFRTGVLFVLSLFFARYGGKAESLAVLIAEGCALMASIFFFQEQFPSSHLAHNAIKIAVSAGTSLILFWLLKGYSWLLAISISMFIYGLMLIFFKVVSLKDSKLTQM
jgi:O-antigen/teichoic acid export membrane protein